jgi:hypothetical protein
MQRRLQVRWPRKKMRNAFTDYKIHGAIFFMLAILVSCCGGCATIRVTDPEYTATQQFLENVASQQAVSQLSMNGLRDQLVFVDSSYLFPPLDHPIEQQLLIEPSFENAFLLGEVRARLLTQGVRLTADRKEATVILEVRSAGVGVDDYEYLFGLSASAVGSIGGAAGAAATAGAAAGTSPVASQLAILQSTKLKGYASVAIVAYRAKTGELIATSGPFVGRTHREDFWIFGFGPHTIGDIPPAEK